MIVSDFNNKNTCLNLKRKRKNKEQDLCLLDFDKFLEEIGPNEEDASMDIKNLQMNKRKLNKATPIKNNVEPVENQILRKAGKPKMKNNKNNKEVKTTPNKQKRKQIKRNSNIYDINNFVVQSSSKKINERREIINIPIPVFSEVSEYFYDVPNVANEDRWEEDQVNFF